MKNLMWVPFIVSSIAVLWTGAFIFTTSCSPPPPEPVKNIRVIPPRSEILYDRDSGQCWVIERSDDGLVVGTLYNSDKVDDCYKFTIKGD